MEFWPQITSGFGAPKTHFEVGKHSSSNFKGQMEYQDSRNTGFQTCVDSTHPKGVCAQNPLGAWGTRMVPKHAPLQINLITITTFIYFLSLFYDVVWLPSSKGNTQLAAYLITPYFFYDQSSPSSLK